MNVHFSDPPMVEHYVRRVERSTECFDVSSRGTIILHLSRGISVLRYAILNGETIKLSPEFSR